MSKEYVYLMTSDGWPQGTCKVGRSKHPHKRAKDIQAPGPVYITELWEVVESRYVLRAEREAHRALTRQHVFREFFSGDLLRIKEAITLSISMYARHVEHCNE